MTLRLPSAPAPLLRIGSAAILLALTSACSDSDHKPGEPAPKYAAEIRRTAYGIPHIKAKDDAGLGYGIAYAYAQDNVCMMAERIVTVNGERAKYFGPEGRDATGETANLASDFFYQLINEPSEITTALSQQPPAMRALLDGYVAGYNQYLADTGKAGLPAACKNAPWVRNMTEADTMKMVRRYATEAGRQFIEALLAAAPPGAASTPAAPASKRAGPSVLDPQFWKQQHARIGSNGVALGKDATENGQGMVLGNPHFPWRGDLRFYQLHLTIPGKLDVMGASLGGMPVVNIGFNKDLAWTHTSNTSTHFSLHQLQLDPSDPTKYLVDGKVQSMVRKTVSVEVRQADGSLRTQSHDFYQTAFGVVASLPGELDWNRKVAYAFFDPNMGNHRMLEQWRAMNSARSLGDFRESIERIVGLPWVNTIAADKEGNTLFMDVTVVPHISSAKEKACVPEAFRAAAKGGVMVLDASTSACQLGNDPAAPQPGIFAGASMPRLERSDYVQNSNDSAWLSNPAAPLTGFPAIVSTDTEEQSGRTRIGLLQLQARLAGTDGMAGKRMSLAQLQELTLSNRVYYAQQTMDEVLRACAGDQAARAADGTAVDLAAPCAKLAAWDRTANLDANIGFGYFTRLWDQLYGAPGFWAVPFDAADPLNTPRGLGLAAPAIRTALANAVLDLADQGWSPDANWGQVQTIERAGKRIPIHGGPHEYGIYNVISNTPAGGGARQVIEGSSYLQTVMFDRNGPQAHTMLSYSQSVDPASPHYADQTALFSSKSWHVMPFTEAQITADPAYKTVSLRQMAKP